MGISKQKIDPEKLSKTFGIEYKKSSLYTPIGTKKKKTFHFSLEEKGKKKSVNLFYNPELPDSVFLQIETENGYSSYIEFSNVNKVTYISEYRKIIFESHTKTHFSILEVYWRGQFSLAHGWEEKIYSKSTWAKSDQIKS
jgi:hypothetical protein